MNKMKIAILGSTGSIGFSTLKILENKKQVKINLLSTNKNYKKILLQSKKFKVKNIIISDKKTFFKTNNIFEKNKIKVFRNLKDYFKKNNNKFDYVMSSISGVEGLKPTLEIIKKTKKIAIANKESIICGWNLIKKELKKYGTEFVPVDSEHFSIWSLIKNVNINLVDKIYITASGGPFLKWSIKKIKNASLSKALNHPNWTMGKKISIDSATMMNKVFEVMEAQRIFNLTKNKIQIIIHEKSYVHAIVKFKNGLCKILIHDTDMKIPIFNSIFDNTNLIFKSNPLDYNLLNNLNFKKIDHKRFPSVKILNKMPNEISLFDTVLISANDELVNMYLNKKIRFGDINIKLNKLINLREFKTLKKKLPRNIDEITILNDYVRLKTRKLCI